MKRIYDRLLLARWVTANLIVAAFFLLAWIEGWIDVVWQSDPTRLTAVIAAVGICGIAWAGYRAWWLSRELDRAGMSPPQGKAGQYLGDPYRVPDHEMLRLKLLVRIRPVAVTGNTLVMLGLIGTVIGFIIALSGVSPAAAADVESVAAMVATLVSGMAVALYTTLVGAVFAIILGINYAILYRGTIDLCAVIVED